MSHVEDARARLDKLKKHFAERNLFLSEGTSAASLVFMMEPEILKRAQARDDRERDKEVEKWRA